MEERQIYTLGGLPNELKQKKLVAGLPNELKQKKLVAGLPNELEETYFARLSNELTHTLQKNSEFYFLVIVLKKLLI